MDKKKAIAGVRCFGERVVQFSEYEALEAENKRFKEALEKIQALAGEAVMQQWDVDSDMIADIAEQALRECGD